MKRKRKNNPLKILALLSLLAAIILTALNLPMIIYSHALSLYNKKEYQKSLPIFEITIALNKNNLDAYYYYAKALDALPMTYNIQKKLFELAHTGKSGAAATIANNKISRYRYFILTQAGRNYIQQVPFQDKILRWNPSSFPLKVYIEPNKNVPPYYLSQVKNAFNTWNKYTNNYLKFEFVNEPNLADIDFRFEEQKKSNCTKSECKYILAYSIPNVNGNKLKKFDIRFSNTDLNNKSFTPQDIYYTSMHEIGHALGIMGHSFNENNLMYPSNIEDNSIHAKYHKKTITAEDLNTIRLLYGLKPDISNIEFTQNDLSKLIYAPVILGTKAEINNQKIEQAKQYINNAPELPVGYIDLASAYYELEQYQECLNNLYKALLLTTDNEAKYQIFYNMAITYFEARDYNNALNYAQMTSNIHSTNEINAVIAYLKFKLGNKKFGINELEFILQNDTQNIDAAQYLIRAYIENKEIMKAGEVLQEIKRNNPDAATDPRILQFGLMNLIFK